MVYGTSIHRPTALPAVAPRINSVKAKATPVFSVISKQAPTALASLKQSPISAAPTTLVSTPQSQVPSAAADFRQLFGGGSPAPSVVSSRPGIWIRGELVRLAAILYADSGGHAVHGG